MDENVGRLMFFVLLISSLLSGTYEFSYVHQRAFDLHSYLDVTKENENLTSSVCMEVQFSNRLCTAESLPLTLLRLYSVGADGDQSEVSVLLNCTRDSHRAAISIGSSINTLLIGHIRLHSFVHYLLQFNYPGALSPHNQVESGLDSCLSPEYTELKVVACGSLTSCLPFLPYVTESAGIDGPHLIRRRREIAIEAYPNDTIVNRTMAAVAESAAQSSGGLSDGALAAAIVVPILVAILAAVGGYFLYRWIHSKRSGHGVYNPGDEESRHNPNQNQTDSNILKKPPEEGLI